MTRVLLPSDIRCPTTGKASWGSEESAQAALQRAWEAPNWRNEHGQMPMRVYECPDCQLWHLTHMERRSA